jgi:hypothetical protein
MMSVPLTQQATKLCVAKLSAKQDGNELEIPTNVPIVFFFIFDIFRK